MNEKFNIESVRQLLNRSTAQLNQPTLERLRDARAQALARHAPSHAPTYAWAGHWRTSSSQHKSYYWVAAVLLAATLFTAAGYWQHLTEHDNSDEDIAILTDELPIDVYVD